MSANHDTCFVIAISGPSGAGKSTAIRNLVACLGDAMALYLDDYEASSTYPDIEQWLADGADPNQFQTPQLSADLRALTAGVAITLPHNGLVVQPARVIVLEEPFGRERAEVADMIDFVVCIDLPLEIALARKLLRMLGFFLTEQTPDAFAKHLQFFLPWYIESGRELYRAVQQRVLQNCDLIADGMLPPDALAHAIEAAIRDKLPQATTASVT
jgi:uridine kinase